MVTPSALPRGMIVTLWSGSANGDWRDHFAFGLVAEEVPRGVLRRWREGRVPADVARVPDADRVAAGYPLPLADR